VIILKILKKVAFFCNDFSRSFVLIYKMVNMDNYDNFRRMVIAQSNNDLEKYVEFFFENAMKFAMNEDFDTAFKIAKDSLLLASYTDIGYRVVYILGGLCELCIDKNEFECANQLFLIGMEILDEKEVDYDEDVNRFLDLKIRIDEGLNKKSLSLPE